MGGLVILNGSVLLVFGLLAGFAYGQAIVRKSEPRTVEAWRAAHSALSMGGALMIAIGAALLQWRDPGPMVAIAGWSLIASGYSFSLSMSLAAASGHRGLLMHGPPANWVVFAGHAVGVVGSAVGTAAFLWLAWVHR